MQKSNMTGMKFVFSDISIAIVLKQMRTLPFETCNSIAPESAIFKKNNCRQGPLCLADIHHWACSILHRYYLSLRPVDQKQKKLEVRFYSRSCNVTSGLGVLVKRLRLAKME